MTKDGENKKTDAGAALPPNFANFADFADTASPNFADFTNFTDAADFAASPDLDASPFPDRSHNIQIAKVMQMAAHAEPELFGQSSAVLMPVNTLDSFVLDTDRLLPPFWNADYWPAD